MKVTVCAWHTLDDHYRSHAERLARSCEAVGIAHDIIGVPAEGGGWEAETRRKPTMMLDALDRNRDCSHIIFLDADAVLVRSPTRALGDFYADVGVCANVRRTNKARLPARLTLRSGTMLLYNCEETRTFLRWWQEEAKRGGRFDPDQTSLLMTLGAPHGASVQFLGREWCCLERERSSCADPIVVHGEAGRARWKVPRIVRALTARWEAA